MAVIAAATGGGDGHRISDDFGPETLEGQWCRLTYNGGECLVRKGESVHRDGAREERVARRCVGAGEKETVFI